MKRILMIILTCLTCLMMAIPAWAGEDYADGDTEQVYTWIQEGDARFCYWNDGGWSTEDMLTGFHTIGDNVYYFSESETNDWRYGQMVTGTVEIYGGTYTFNSEGHMVDCYGGLE